MIFPECEGRHIFVGTSAYNELDRRIDEFHCFGCFFCQSSVLIHSLVTDLPWTVHFIPKAPGFESVWILLSVFDTEITVFGSTWMIAVFQKVAGICDSSCSQIDRHHNL